MVHAFTMVQSTRKGLRFMGIPAPAMFAQRSWDRFLPARPVSGTSPTERARAAFCSRLQIPPRSIILDLSVVAFDLLRLADVARFCRRTPPTVRFSWGRQRSRCRPRRWMSPISLSFVATLEGFVAQREIPLVQFRKGQRIDQVMSEHLSKFRQEEGVVFVGKALEKTPVFRLSCAGPERLQKKSATAFGRRRSTAFCASRLA
jgi:hypothetical protein